MYGEMKFKGIKLWIVKIILVKYYCFIELNVYGRLFINII